MATSHDIRNKLTEHKTNYKLCNTYLTDCYAALYPSSWTKLALVIFSTLLSTKKYHEPNSKFYSAQEDKRIFTNVLLNPAIILEKCHPVKYIFEKGDSSKDSSNMVKRVNELDENNIFYVWRYGYPHIYMFVMERDIGLWKYFNPGAYVTPKTLRKIIYSTSGMTKSMLEMSDKGEINDVRVSFCEFVDSLIDRMNPEVQKKLVRWKEGDSYKDYLRGLRDQIDTCDPYEGLVEDEHFYERLPQGVKDKIKPKRKKRKSHPDLESQLVPDNGNVVKPKVVRKKRQRKPTTNPVAKLETFESVDPFKNENDFIKFYRAMVTISRPNASLFPHDTEIRFAAEIMDILDENSRSDKQFLKSWITYYIDHKLKGDKSKRMDATSLSTFKKSFSEYNNKYMSFQV